MDLLATILTCSLYASDDALVRAIAEGPSGKNPYFILNTAVEDGLLTPEGERLVLTDRGRLLADGVVRTLLG